MKKIFLGMVVFAALAVLGFTLYSTLLYRTKRTYPDTTVVIAPGTGARETLKQLHDAGLTPSLWLTALPVVTSKQYKSLKAGEYFFATGLTPAQIIGQIARGEIVVHKVTIPEGWNSWQVRAALTQEPLLTGELPSVIAEGSVFPDTTLFTRGQSRVQLLEAMQKKQQEVLMELWAKRAENLPIATPEEALILASIVEKETGEPEERAEVAAVFVNRLRIGMRLQSDPTVVYGIERARGGAPMGRELTSADLQADTPYNSYTRTGLPPTPICNPGREAMAAALNPANSKALYFVATGHGGHRFAQTLKEHNANVQAYRKAIRGP